MSIEGRYMTKDISIGLVLYSSLGKRLSIPNPDKPELNIDD